MNTGIHYAVFYVLLNAIGLHYLLSSGLGYGCGLLNSYVLNRRLTFRAEGRHSLPEFSKFVIVNLAALSINLVMMRTLVEYIKIIPEIAQILSIIGSLVVNFAGNKFWTFKT